MKHAIFLSIDRRYFPFALLYLESLDRHFPEHPDVLLHHHDLEPGQLPALARFARVRPVAVDVEAMRRWPGITLSGQGVFEGASACYARYWAWSDLYDEYDNLLYMDVDVLVLGPLDGCLSGDRFRIGREAYQRFDKYFRKPDDPAVLALLEEDGIRLDGVNRNAGVMLIPRRYRSREAFAELVGITRRYLGHLSMADQTVINLWMHKHRVETEPLGAEYNFLPGFLGEKVCSPLELSRIRVFHFAGLWERPWLRLAWMRTTLAVSGTPLFLPYLCLVNLAYKALYGLKKLLLRLAGRPR